MNRDALLQHVGAAIGTHAPEGERALRIVYGILRENAVSAGQLAEFEAHIPRDIAAFLASVQTP